MAKIAIVLNKQDEYIKRSFDNVADAKTYVTEMLEFVEVKTSNETVANFTNGWIMTSNYNLNKLLGKKK